MNRPFQVLSSTISDIRTGGGFDFLRSQTRNRSFGVPTPQGELLVKLSFKYIAAFYCFEIGCYPMCSNSSAHSPESPTVKSFLISRQNNSKEESISAMPG